jgi:LysM repeat protein
LNFTDKHAVLFLCDPEERLECFFTWNENQDDLEETAGYFIFFDKNEGMNEMLTNAKPLLKTKEENVITEHKSRKAEPKKREKSELEAEELKDLSEEKGSLRFSVEKAKRVADINRQKRLIKMMTSISMLLFFACVIMGIGLLQSGERITRIETQLRELRTGYNNIASRLNDNAYPAFAAQSIYEGGFENAANESEPANAAASDSENLMEQALSIVEANSSTNISASETHEPSELPIQAAEPAVITDLAATAPEAAASAVPVTEYIVKSGDTLSQISQRFYGTTQKVEEIMQVNNISSPYRLRVGSTLIIP